MVQLVGVMALGALAYYCYSSYRSHRQRLRDNNVSWPPNEVDADLERDPKTGIYRPKK